MAFNRRKFRPMNVVVARGSRAEGVFRSRARLPEEEFLTEELVAGVPPRPNHNLVFHGGKTIPDLNFRNFYLGGDASWAHSDLENIDHALAAAMSDSNLNNVMMQYF